MEPEITKQEREEFRALHAKTTQGEWHYDDGVTDGEGTADAERGKDPWVMAANGTLVAALEGVEDPDPATVPALDEMDANGKFIARAHGVVPRLLRALSAAEANYERCAKASRGVLETRDILFREHEALKAKLAEAEAAIDAFGDLLAKWMARERKSADEAIAAAKEPQP